MGSMDNGLFVISGKVKEGISLKKADEEIEQFLAEFKESEITKEELTKVKNKVESTEQFSLMNSLNKAMRIGYFELLGDANLINTEIDRYMKVTREDIQNVAKKYFRKCGI